MIPKRTQYAENSLPQLSPPENHEGLTQAASETLLRLIPTSGGTSEKVGSCLLNFEDTTGFPAHFSTERL